MLLFECIGAVAGYIAIWVILWIAIRIPGMVWQITPEVYYRRGAKGVWLWWIGVAVAEFILGVWIVGMHFFIQERILK